MKPGPKTAPGVRTGFRRIGPPPIRERRRKHRRSDQPKAYSDIQPTRQAMFHVGLRCANPTYGSFDGSARRCSGKDGDDHLRGSVVSLSRSGQARKIHAFVK